MAAKTIAELLAESTPIERAKALRHTFRASWHGVAANDNAVRCTCNDEPGSPAPEACPVHDGGAW